jgi:hypothetical protein
MLWNSYHTLKHALSASKILETNTWRQKCSHDNPRFPYEVAIRCTFWAKKSLLLCEEPGFAPGNRAATETAYSWQQRLALWVPMMARHAKKIGDLNKTIIEFGHDLSTVVRSPLLYNARLLRFKAECCK